MHRFRLSTGQNEDKNSQPLGRLSISNLTFRSSVAFIPSPSIEGGKPKRSHKLNRRSHRTYWHH